MKSDPEPGKLEGHTQTKERKSMKEEKRVLINLLAIAHYDQMPDYPIQMMTIGKLQTLPDGQICAL